MLIVFFPENVCFLCPLNIFKYTLDFIMKANAMNPDQTESTLICWDQSDLQYKLPKNISNSESKWQKL